MSSSKSPVADFEEVGPTSNVRMPPSRSSQNPNQIQRSNQYWRPSERLLESIRDHSDACGRGSIVAIIQRKSAVARHRFWSAITGADIPLNASQISMDVELPHPNGVVIHPEVQLGPKCRVFQQVTIGTGPKPGVPRIGARVWIGAGAKVLGGVFVGDDAVIGANAVVIEDVPAGAIAVGVPAVIKLDARGRWDAHKRNALG